MKTTNNNSEIPINFSNRESLLSANSEIIKQLQARLKAKRWRPQDGDSLKLAYILVYLESLKTQNSILKDVELDQLQSDIQELKEALKSRSRE
jgi:hypothetical protein